LPLLLPNTSAPNHCTPPLCSYVTKGEDKVGTEVKLNVRGKMNPATVSKTPFVPAKYYKKA